MDVVGQYSSILAKCLKTYGLESIDIAFLSKTSKKSIDAVLARSGSVTLESLEAIAQVFGLHYFELGNPDIQIPNAKDLPAKTQKRIAYRQQHGPSEPVNYQSLHLNEKILIILSDYTVKDYFSGNKIAQELKERFDLELSVSQILDRFKKAFKEQVIRTNVQVEQSTSRGPKPYYYQLTTSIEPQKLQQARQKITKK
jgi:hypothetical protein